MSTEKRFIVFICLAALILFGTNPLLERLGLVEPPKPIQEVTPRAELAAEARPMAAFAGQPDGPGAFAGEDGPAAEPALAPAPEAEAKPEAPAAPAAEAAPAVERVAQPLSIGEADPSAKPALGYEMRVDLTQDGAGVSAITLAHHEAEEMRGQPKDARLRLLSTRLDPLDSPPPFGLSLLLPGAAADGGDEVISLDDRRWEVVADDQGQLVRPLPPDAKAGKLEGQEVVFRTTVARLGVTLTKAFQLRKGIDGFELRLGFESDQPLELAYRLIGPHGLPIEGEWYTQNFREVFFGKVSGDGTEVTTFQATEVVDKEAKGDPVRTTTLPLKFAGVENQYFAIFLEPDPLPDSPESRRDARAFATAVRVPPEKHKADVGVAVDSKPFKLAAGRPSVQAYRVFAGPKTPEALAPYGAEDLATYRKGWSLPGSTTMARYVITPLLGWIYGLTTVVARILGGTQGNYGIAIILLTITVRLILFPLSRKQAASAKKMQDLQPQLTALREKYKDDKERMGKETMELYRTAGVNPFGGCLLAIIQMPIFFGLWQALNNSVALRGAHFLWIDNLAAPDKLFPFPIEVPFLGPYFNVLPLAVAGLMLVHMKLFQPPAASPEMQSQQKIMKYMMVFMAFMFYRVPSGLGIYFITSSGWAIAERLLLPKHLKTHAPAVSAEEEGRDRPRGGPGGKPAPLPGGGKPGAAGGNGASKPGWRDRLRERLEDVIEEANAKDRTYRKEDRGKERGNDKDRDRRDADRKRRPNPGPGRKR